MAGWLASVAGERADAVAEGVAEHYAQALDSLPSIASEELPSRGSLGAEAAAWYERAAEAALRLAAHEACCRLMARACELTDAAPSAELARRRRRLGEVLSASADLDAGIVELEESLACCPDDAASVEASAYALGRAYMQQIRFAEAERLMAETLERLDGEPDALRATAPRPPRVGGGRPGSSGGRGGGSRRRPGHGARRVIRSSSSRCSSTPAPRATRSARPRWSDWAELEERARALGAWQQVVSAARIRATYLAFDDPEAGMAAMADAGELARTHGQLEQAGWCDYARCEQLWVVGRWDEALTVGMSRRGPRRTQRLRAARVPDLRRAAPAGGRPWRPGAGRPLRGLDRGRHDRAHRR